MFDDFCFYLLMFCCCCFLGGVCLCFFFLFFFLLFLRGEGGGSLLVLLCGPSIFCFHISFLFMTSNLNKTIFFLQNVNENSTQNPRRRSNYKYASALTLSSSCLCFSLNTLWDDKNEEIT